MKHIEKIMVSIMILCMLFTLAACGDASGDTETTATPTAVVTPTPEAPTPTPTPEDDGKVTYTVKVVDEGNNPLANVMVQLCLDSCLPGMTAADGVATFRVVEADYKVSVVTLPEGYEHASDATDFYFEEGSTDMTITLKAIA